MAVPRIGARKPRRLYLEAWRRARGLSQKQLADRLEVTDMTVSRWETGKALLNTNVMSALADALDIEPQDLYSPPDRPSPEMLLRDQPDDVIDQAIAIIKAIRK